MCIRDRAYRFGVDSGIWALGNAFAIPAVWEDGAWRTDEYYPVGDPFPVSYTHLDVYKRQTKRHPEIELYETLLQPTDDEIVYPYLTYDNALVWRALTADVYKRQGRWK